MRPDPRPRSTEPRTMHSAIVGSILVAFAVAQAIGFLLLLRLVDPYEREPISAIALLALWGAIGATSLSAIGNVAVERLLPARIHLVFGDAIASPIVEEVAKGLALVLFLVLATTARGRLGIPRFEGVTDGIVYGAAVGIGFAFTEDILYLLLAYSNRGSNEGLVAFLSRRDFFGVVSLRHAVFTAMFGVGLGLATWSRGRLSRGVFPLLGLVLAMGLHAANNGLVNLALVLRHGFDTTVGYLNGTVPAATRVALDADVSTYAGLTVDLEYAFLALLVGAALLWTAYQRRVIREELDDEVERGLISRTEWHLLPSYWRRTRWYWQLVRTGQWERLRLLRRIHNDLVNLALLKRRMARKGRTGEEIDRTRQVIEKLKAQKALFLSAARATTRRAERDSEDDQRRRTQRLEVLRSIGVFDGAPEASLLRLVASLEERRLPAGRTVIREGRIPSFFYVILEGSVEIVTAGERGEEPTVIRTLDRGSYFGEIGLLEGMPSIASVRTRTPCTLYRIRGHDFLTVIDDSPALSEALRDRVTSALAESYPSYRPTS